MTRKPATCSLFKSCGFCSMRPKSVLQVLILAIGRLRHCQAERKAIVMSSSKICENLRHHRHHKLWNAPISAAIVVNHKTPQCTRARRWSESHVLRMLIKPHDGGVEEADRLQQFFNDDLLVVYSHLLLQKISLLLAKRACE